MTGYNPPKTVRERDLHIPVVPLEEDMRAERRAIRREKIGNAALALGASAVLAFAAYHINARFDDDRVVESPVAPQVAEDIMQSAEDMQEGQLLTEADMQQVNQINETTQKEN